MAVSTIPAAGLVSPLTTDYIEIYGQFGVGQNVSQGSVYTWFNGSMVRGA
jgi:hypothetical protein